MWVDGTPRRGTAAAYYGSRFADPITWRVRRIDDSPLFCKAAGACGTRQVSATFAAVVEGPVERDRARSPARWPNGLHVRAGCQLGTGKCQPVLAVG